MSHLHLVKPPPPGRDWWPFAIGLGASLIVSLGVWFLHELLWKGVR